MPDSSGRRGAAANDPAPDRGRRPSAIRRDPGEPRPGLTRAQLAAIVESADDAIIAKALDGTITSWNRGAEHLYGYAAASAIGRPIAILEPADRFGEVEALIDRVRRDGAVSNYETVRVKQDGTSVSVSLTLSPIHDEDGGVVGVSAIVRDISDRMRLEEANRAAEQGFRSAHEELRRFVDSNIVGVVIADAAGRILEANDYYLRLIGHTHADLDEGRIDWRALTPPECLAADETAIAQLRETGICTPYEKEYVRRDGTRVAVFLADAMLPGPGERIAAFALDITARKRAERDLACLNAELEERVRARTAELEDANGELEAFSYSVSHDLRAPLRALQGFSRILLDEHSEHLCAEGRRYFALIREDSDRMGRLVDGLLRLSRLGRQTLDRRCIDMAALFREAFENLRGQAPSRVVDFEIGRLPACVGDYDLLNQLAANLLSNALKFTRTRPVARISVQTAPGLARRDEVVYAVRDNGVGFDMAYIDKLFQVFQRLHSGRDYEGTGVGLATVQRIVKRHGGRVWAEAVVDGGATFFVALPSRTNE